MIILAKSIQVGKRIIPAGMILDDKYQTGICYYKGTKIDFSKIDPSAIYVPGRSKEQLTSTSIYKDAIDTKIENPRGLVRTIYVQGGSSIDTQKYDNDARTSRLTFAPITTMPLSSTEAAKVGDKVDVVDYDYDMPGHAVVIKSGKLQEIGTYAQLRAIIKQENKQAFEYLSKICRSGREIVWKVANTWFCHEGGKYGIESDDIKIIPSDTPNTDIVVVNNVPVATIISKELTKQSYPDFGYVNDEDHKITVLNNNNEPVELKCLEDDVVMEQVLLDELLPIVTANATESETIAKMKTTQTMSKKLQLQVAALIGKCELAFGNVESYTDKNHFVAMTTGTTSCIVEINDANKSVKVSCEDKRIEDYVRAIVRKTLTDFNFHAITM